MYYDTEHVLFRIVTIGDSSVGKTCLVKQFIHKTFDDHEHNTVGAFFQSFQTQREGREIEIQLWDTAGQEQYRSLGTVYFREAAGAVLLFDITNRNSFQNVDGWLSTFRQIGGPKTVVILVGNKCDLRDRVVTNEEAGSWASSHDCLYFEASAMTGENVPKIFDALVDQLLLKNNISLDSSPRSQNFDILSQPTNQPTGCC